MDKDLPPHRSIVVGYTWFDWPMRVISSVLLFVGLLVLATLGEIPGLVRELFRWLRQRE